MYRYREPASTYTGTEGDIARAPYQVRVPEPDGTPERQLPHQQVVHPTERELQELYALVLYVVVKTGYNIASRRSRALQHMLLYMIYK